METVVTEGNVRTIETVSERTVTSKTVVQRTANTNSTQVNKYDAEGNLKSSTEVDKDSWEERDTKSYEWSKPADRPPTPSATDGTVAVAGSDLSVEKFLQEGPPSDGATLVMTTSENVPGVQWSGTTIEQRDLPVASAAGDVTTNPSSAATAAVTVPDKPATTAAAAPPESVAVDGAVVAASEVQASQRITTNVQGESSSRSGEVVWITETTKKPAAPNAAAAADAGIPAAILPASAQSPPVETTVPVATNQVQQTPSPAVQPPPPLQQTLSVEERRRNRCIENRARKAAVANAGIALTSA